MLLRSNPGLYIFVLDTYGKFGQVKEFMEWCKTFEFGDLGEYSVYVHGYWLPWLAKQRQAGKLKKGKSNFSSYERISSLTTKLV